jgi:hypothetical protein
MRMRDADADLGLNAWLLNTMIWQIPISRSARRIRIRIRIRIMR